MIKRIASVILIMIISSLVSCAVRDEKVDSNLDLFNMMYGKEITTEYLRNISEGNIDAANELCLLELVESNKNTGIGVSKISSFQLDKTVEGSNYGYYIYNVIRAASNEPKCDLESYILKVKKINGLYEITDIKAKPQRELYIKNKSLRIVGEDGASSKLVINLSNIPKDSYMKSNSIMMYKEKVPSDEFGKVVLGFTGKKIAISTINENSAYVCITLIDDSMMEGNGAAGAVGESLGESALVNLQDVFEKPVAKKLISIDLLQNSDIKDFIFSKQDDNLAINYSNKDGIDRINIYKTEDGSVVGTNFEKEFPEDKYSLDGKYFDNNNFIFNVGTIDNSENELVGKYSIDLKTLEMKKL